MAHELLIEMREGCFVGEKSSKQVEICNFNDIVEAWNLSIKM